MAASPDLKVYRNGEYVASCKYAEDAAAIVALSGGEIRLGHTARHTIYRDGETYAGKVVRADDSIDEVAEVVHLAIAKRQAERQREARERNERLEALLAERKRAALG